jgi:hypothetical protein
MSDLPQETAEKLPGDGKKKMPQGKPFKKGYDPRRNLKGVPAEAVAARKAIRKLGAELVHIKEKVWDDERQGYIEVEYDITRWEAMIRLMFSSRAPRDRELLLKAGLPGLLKEEMDLTSGGEKLQPPQIVEVVKTYEPKEPGE